MNLHSHVLVVDCSDRDDLLTRRQFVWPIQRNIHGLSSSIHLSKFSKSSLKGFDAVIFSGCTLKDNAFVSHAKNLGWLKEAGIPLLGICAGHELLGIVFGGKLERLKVPVIGMETVKVDGRKAHGLHLEEGVFSAYHLNGNAVSLPKGFMGVGQSTRVKNEIMIHPELKVVGFQFHPEYIHGKFIQSFIYWAEKKN